MTRLPRSNSQSTMRLLRPDLQIRPTQNPPGCSVRDERSGKVYEFGEVEEFLLTQLRKPYRAEDLSKACNRRFEQSYTSQDSEDIIQMLKGWELLAEEPDSRCKELNGEQTADEAPETVIPPDREAAQTDPSSEHAGLTRQPAGRHLFCKPGIFQLYGNPQRSR